MIQLHLDAVFHSTLINSFNESEEYSGGPAYIYVASKEIKWRTLMVYLALWCKLFDHNFSDVKMMNNFHGSPITHVTDQTQLYLLFPSQEHQEHFTSWVNGLSIPSGIFPPMPSGQLSGVIVPYPLCSDKPTMDHSTMEFSTIVREHDIIIAKWMNDNCIGKYYRYGELFFFENPDDATLFKLTYVAS